MIWCLIIGIENGPLLNSLVCNDDKKNDSI